MMKIYYKLKNFMRNNCKNVFINIVYYLEIVPMWILIIASIVWILFIFFYVIIINRAV